MLQNKTKIIYEQAKIVSTLQRCFQASLSRNFFYEGYFF